MAEYHSVKSFLLPAISFHNNQYKNWKFLMSLHVLNLIRVVNSINFIYIIHFIAHTKAIQFEHFSWQLNLNN